MGLLPALLVAGCALSPGGSLPPLPPEASGEAGYRLAPGDRVRVTVFGAENLSGEFPVNTVGKVSLPLIGSVAALGLTPRQLAAAIGRRLRDGYMRDPKISVAVTEHRPIYVLGEVSEPGRYEYVPDMTVLNAVALAGGYSYRANQGHVTVSRDGHDYRAPTNAELQPDEVVRVPERYF
jgi:polysaccharide export outer membrane protein